MQAELTNLLEREKQWRHLLEKLTLEKRRTEGVLDKLEAAAWIDSSLRIHLDNARRNFSTDFGPPRPRTPAPEAVKAAVAEDLVDDAPMTIQSQFREQRQRDKRELDELRSRVEELADKNEKLSLRLAGEQRSSKDLRETLNGLSKNRKMEIAFLELEKKLKEMFVREVEREAKVREIKKERDSLTEELLAEKRRQIEKDKIYEMSKPEIILNETFTLLEEEKERSNKLQAEVDRLMKLTDTELVSKQVDDFKQKIGVLEKELDFMRSAISSTGDSLERAVNQRISRRQEPIIRIQREAIKGVKVQLTKMKEVAKASNEKEMNDFFSSRGERQEYDLVPPSKSRDVSRQSCCCRLISIYIHGSRFSIIFHFRFGNAEEG